MAHPLAQPAEALVDLDRWVRDGGRVLLLADPQLEWPSERPLGDKLRPPPAFADTGLLRALGAAARCAGRSAARGSCELGGRSVLTASPGVALRRVQRSAKPGSSRAAGSGEGRRPSSPTPTSSMSSLLDGPTENNLDALLAELAALER